MTTLHHYGTCQVWETGSWNNCTCHRVAPWRIRKEPEEQFPWRIWRRTSDMTYEPLMRCASWAGALALVHQFQWLRANATWRDTNA